MGSHIFGFLGVRQFFILGYIGMCRCEGYGFQAIYSRMRGFQLFCKVADILLKAPDVNFFLAP